MAQVGCAGILVEDTFCGPMPELPREGQLLALDAMTTHAGGCAANVAISLAKQHISTEVVGCLGNGPSASVILQELEASRVGCGRLVHTPDYPTSRTVILLVQGQDRRYLHVFGANAAFAAAHIPREWLAELKVFYLGGLFLMPSFRTEEFLELLKFCRERGVVSVVDVVIPQNVQKLKDMASLLPFIDYFLPNEVEAQAITGCLRPLDQLRALLSGGVGTAVVTCGKNGAWAGRGRKCWRAGCFPVQSVDPSGSGDAFAGGIITGIVRHWELPRTLAYASALGASAVRAIGTTTGVFTAPEAETFLATHELPIELIDL